jgi:hypothetical protein
VLNGQPDSIMDFFMITKANFLFRKVLGQNPKDKGAKLYLQRSEYYGLKGVPLDWEGIDTIENK